MSRQNQHDLKKKTFSIVSLSDLSSVNIYESDAEKDVYRGGASEQKKSKQPTEVSREGGENKAGCHGDKTALSRSNRNAY